MEDILERNLGKFGKRSVRRIAPIGSLCSERFLSGQSSVTCSTSPSTSVSDREHAPPQGQELVPIVPAPAEIRCRSVRAARAFTSSCALMHIGHFACAVVELIATIVLPLFLKHSAPLNDAAGSYQSCREKCARDSCDLCTGRLLILVKEFAVGSAFANFRR